MTAKDFSIHPQLRTDSHNLFRWQNCHLRLHKNASLPWLIIIPETKHIEFHDLNADLQLAITKISQLTSHLFKSACGAEKINFAAIGNVVQQLHIHVIGRHREDPLWPDVVWGGQLPDKFYTDQQLVHFKAELMLKLEQL